MRVIIYKSTSLNSIKKTRCFLSFFFFNDTATTEIYTLSLHDALPILHIYIYIQPQNKSQFKDLPLFPILNCCDTLIFLRSEEHTSELQSQSNLVCRLLLEKKKSSRISQEGLVCQLRLSYAKNDHK